jgi:hypothetical protein
VSPATDIGPAGRGAGVCVVFVVLVWFRLRGGVWSGCGWLAR